MTKYIFLNGPIDSGLNKVAELLCRMINSQGLEPCVYLTSMSFPLTDFFVAALAQPWDQLKGDGGKAVLNGRSGNDAVRQLQTHLRAVYGPDVLGRWLEHRVLGKAQPPKFVIVSGAMFQGDIDRFAVYRSKLIRVSKEGPHKDGLEFVPLADPDWTIVVEDVLFYHQIRAIAGALVNG